jgi:C-terminal processing protease CtpA/Prc
VLIEDVARQSEAERAGLLAGDVVASIDQGPPISAADARRRLSGPEGSDVVIEVLREGVRVSARIRRERVRR